MKKKFSFKKEIKKEARNTAIALSRVSVLMYLFYSGLYFSEEPHQNIAYSLLALFGLLYLYGYEYSRTSGRVIKVVKEK